VSLERELRGVPADIAVAFQFLTRLPMPRISFEEGSLARSVKFFPLVGLAVGASAALLERLLRPHLARPLCALAVVVFLVIITGCFHEDGLADTADSLGAWTPERRLQIMRDSRIGSYGAAALILSLLTRVALISYLPVEHVAAWLIGAHVLCRWSTLPLSHFIEPARAGDGQGARIARLTSRASLIFGSLFTLCIVIFALRRAAIAPIIIAILLVVTSARFYTRRLGGVTGDCFGATNQLTEIAVYLCGTWIP
jgi:adenosylcobinamide-GDP ribazoletransferase